MESDSDGKLVYDRREALKYLGGLGAAVLSLDALLGCASQAYAQSSNRGKSAKPKSSQPSLEELARKWKMPLSRVQEIAREMKQPVEKTLRGYATFVCHDSYDREVFQRHLPPSQRKAALVFFYAGFGPSRGLASVLRQLAKEYGDKISFLAYKDTCDSWSSEGNFRNLRRFYDIRAPPSTAMYSLFDLLSGETAQNNDKRIKRIDTLRSGFSKIRNWKAGYDVLVRWLETNIVNPNGSDVTRFNNTSKPRKYSYF